MCAFCDAVHDNKVTLNKNGDVLDLSRQVVTDSDGEEHDAHELTELFIDTLAHDGENQAEDWANNEITSFD